MRRWSSPSLLEGARKRPERTAEVSVIFRFVTKSGLAIAVADGTETVDPETGEIKDKLFFLPLAAVAIEGVDLKDTAALKALAGTAIELTAPERLLKAKGLL
jgi:hypothetical protein